ncbi:MAG: hypothetical protein DHS20C15_22020 [Planctomycetota bacterium]|nr:MAG: hypothetical protein DHS20C15_22020 [Planctomycetota bacterium]
MVFGGFDEVSYWPPGEPSCKLRHDTLGFVALAHDWTASAHDGTASAHGFISGVTNGGVSVVVEYRVTGAGYEQRRVLESACLGMLTGLVHDAHAQRLLLWDAQAERLFEFSLERSELRLLADVDSIPELAGLRALWWLDGSTLWLSTGWLTDHHSDPAYHTKLHDFSAHDGRIDRYQAFDIHGRPRTERLPAPVSPDTTVHAFPAPEAW